MKLAENILILVQKRYRVVHGGLYMAQNRNIQLRAVRSFVSCFLFTSSAMAVTFPLTVNGNAEVTFVGSKSQTELVSANVAKNVTLDWITSTSDVQVSVKSLNLKLNDTTFTTSIEVSSSNFPAWNSSTVYLLYLINQKHL